MGNLFTNTKFKLFYINSFKVKLSHFSFSNRIIYLMSFLYTLIALVFICYHFILLILLMLTTKWSTSIILGNNLKEDFLFIRKLE